MIETGATYAHRSMALMAVMGLSVDLMHSPHAVEIELICSMWQAWSMSGSWGTSSWICESFKFHSINKSASRLASKLKAHGLLKARRLIAHVCVEEVTSRRWCTMASAKTLTTAQRVLNRMFDI